MGDEWFRQARLRARRRRNPRNLLLFVIAFFFIAGAFAGMYLLITLFQNNLFPPTAFFGNYTRLGGILMYVPLLFPSIIMGFLLAKLVVWLIPPARAALDREAQEAVGVDFLSSTLVLVHVVIPVGPCSLQLMSTRGLTSRRFTPREIAAAEAFASSLISS